ncbi:MAG: hypothetical protein ACREBS_06365 [Nitrososphaerales archaeon]
MEFPDRPIATAGLGIACALILLVILSWPVLLGFGTPILNSAKTPSYTPQSSTVEYATNGMSSVSSTATAATTTPSQVGGSTVSSASVLSSSASVTQAPTATFSSTTNPKQSSPMTATITASSATETIQSTAQANAQDLFAFPSSIAGHANGFTLAVLSIASLGIALGSMFFVYRKVNSENSEEE